jgi:uncharacterized phage infection (PIP) family protein YhgE
VAIKIPLVADVDKAIRGVEDVADAFEKVQDALEDVTKDAKKTEDALEDVGDGTKKAEDASDDMAKKFRDDFDKIRKDSKTAGDGIGTGVKDGTRKAGEGMDNLKGEANETAREVGASFDGSAESIAEGFQEVAANALAGFGPAGAAAGLAAAAGIGIAISKLTEYAEKVNESKAAGAEWAQEFNMGPLEDRIDALRSAWQEMASTIVDDRQWFELWQEDAVSALDAVVQAQEKAGTSTADFMNAFNEADPGKRLDGLKEYREQLEAMSDAYDKSNKAATDRLNVPEARAYGEKRDAVDQLVGVLDDEIRKQEVANDVENASADAVKGTAQEIAQKNDAIEESNDLLEENVDANRSAISAEFDLADAQKELNSALRDGVKRGREGKQALFEYSDSIIGMADAAAEASGDQADYNREIAEGRKKFYEAADAMGYTRGQARELARAMGLVPRKVEIKATDNDTADQTRRKVEDLLGYAGVKKDVTLGVRASTAQASLDVANWRHAQQSIPVSIGLRAV